ncbi:unannotated protein [freshwater metagenome]|uniref:Unannotated protein n=1 Tax=freshwater metagenome TaxID=449393 RepID=A0A6J7QVJ9_9ZZZZ
MVTSPVRSIHRRQRLSSVGSSVQSATPSMGSDSKPDAPESDAPKSDGEDTLSLRSLMTLAGLLVGLNASDDLADLF